MELKPSEQLISFHPLVEQTRRILEGQLPDQYSRVRAFTGEYFDIAVSKTSIVQAIDIINSLILRFQSLHWKIKPGYSNNPYRYSFAHIEIDEQEIPISIFQSAKIDYDAPIDKRGRQAYRHSPYLRVSVGRYTKKIFLETCDYLIESQIQDFIEAARIYADRSKHEQQEALKALKVKQEEQRLEEVQRVKIAHLNSASETWEKCTRLRNLLKVVAAQMDSGGVTSARLEAVKQWHQWASEYVESIDPIKQFIDWGECSPK